MEFTKLILSHCSISEVATVTSVVHIVLLGLHSERQYNKAVKGTALKDSS